jgi:hypothetical protein
MTAVLVASSSGGAPDIADALSADELLDALGPSDSEDVSRRARATPPRTVATRTAAYVAAEDVVALWPGRLYAGKVAALCGAVGVGKSYLALDVAARLSRGTTWPDGAPCEATNVVLLSAEDGVADTIVPRLALLDADLYHIHVIDGYRQERGAAYEGPLSLAADLDMVEQAISRHGAGLLIIDPIGAFIPGVNSYNDAEVRSQILAPLAALAARTGCAILLVMHLNKDENKSALNRPMGSPAFIGQARVALALGRDPANPERRILASLKNNLAPPAPSLAFTITGDGIVWESGPVEIDADAAMASGPRGEERSERDHAADFLRQVLADGPVPAKDAKRLAREAGISDMTLRRARAVAGVAVHREGFGKGGVWVWSLDPTAKVFTPPAQSRGSPFQKMNIYDDDRSIFASQSAIDVKVFTSGHMEGHLREGGHLCSAHPDAPHYPASPDDATGPQVCGVCHPRPQGSGA